MPLRPGAERGGVKSIGMWAIGLFAALSIAPCAGPSRADAASAAKWAAKSTEFIRTVRNNFYDRQAAFGWAARNRNFAASVRSDEDFERAARRALAEQSPHRQLEVARREAVQIQLWQKLPDLVRPSPKQRQHSAEEGLLGVAHPRPAQSDRSDAGRKAALFAVTISVSGRAAEISSLGAHSTEQAFDLFLQDLLEQLLDGEPGETLDVPVNDSAPLLCAGRRR
jgi:hypothetical protein